MIMVSLLYDQVISFKHLLALLIDTFYFIYPQMIPSDQNARTQTRGGLA